MGLHPLLNIGPLDSYHFNLDLVVQFDNTIRFATHESVRPGLTAKGSFKTSNSEWRTIFISINYMKISLANVWLANVSIPTTFLMWIFLSKRTRKNEQFFDKKAPFWQVFNDEEFPLKATFENNHFPLKNWLFLQSFYID